MNPFIFPLLLYTKEDMFALTCKQFGVTNPQLPFQKRKQKKPALVGPERSKLRYSYSCLKGAFERYCPKFNCFVFF